CRFQSEAPQQQAADGIIRQTLLPLLTDAAVLETDLERTEAGAADSQPGWTADALIAAVEQRLTTLRTHFQTRVAELIATASGGAAVREIDAALTVPLIPWDARQRLVHKQLEL